MSVDGEQPPADLALSLDRDPGAPSVARAAITGFCEGRDLSGAVLSTLLLLVSEIVTNAVVHADAPGSAPVRFAAWLHAAFVRVEVTDQGSGFTAQPRDPDRVDGGYGLFLLEKQARRWGVSRAQGTTVWFEVETSPA
ncbi:MAG TPA: ATP-binding protein [Solirubrobacteraceae bacterium]|nr:ATP-binding protein [Solirubrobacteraceae bacterium]